MTLRPPQRHWKGRPNTKKDFEGQILKTDACWLWTGTTWKKYGMFRFDGKMWRTHRLAYTIFIGPIPAGMCVLHHCDNPPCVNPSHLFIGTPKDNAKDRNTKGRTARGESSGTAKLTGNMVRLIRADNRKHYEIAKQYNIASSTVSEIKNHKYWTHL